MEQKFQIQLQRIGNDKIDQIECTDTENLLEVMLRQGISYRSDCGGRGTCGKCKIRLVEGELEVTTSDQKTLTATEVEQGYRLSCKAHPTGDCTIELLSDSDDYFEIVTQSVNYSDTKKTIEQTEEQSKHHSYIIGIDLGTTTIAIHLADAATGNIIQDYSMTNEQRIYGADVISRISASKEGKRKKLMYLIRKNLQKGILTVVETSGVEAEKVDKIAISGNTTMGHLLMGYSCEGLGAYPFTPVNIGTIEVTFRELFNFGDHDEALSSEDILFIEKMKKVPVVLLPGISTFVGGDITAGLLFCGFYRAERPCLLIDLGTNGEMAIGNRENILVTSTAAGPAFEGVNISCGVGSVSGAISSFDIQGERVSYKTIGDQPPIGICGTGVVELVSELRNAGLMDETGLLSNPYFEQGYPIKLNETHTPYMVTNTHDHSTAMVFTQKDIRELQLAKAAVRAGIEILFRRYGITYDQIDTVYLAGGFGYKINVEKAVNIGLIPKELLGKIKAVGNSSLAGAEQFLTEEDSKEHIEQILSVSKEIYLSEEEEFNDLFIKYMSF